MPTIQIRLSEDIDKKIQYYMLDKDIKDKKTAIVEILKQQLIK